MTTTSSDFDEMMTRLRASEDWATASASERARRILVGLGDDDDQCPGCGGIFADPADDHEPGFGDVEPCTQCLMCTDCCGHDDESGASAGIPTADPLSATESPQNAPGVVPGANVTPFSGPRTRRGSRGTGRGHRTPPDAA